MVRLRRLPPQELLKLYGDLLDELKRRGIVRSRNNPAADYAEDIFCNAFGWERAPKNAKGFDALSKKGTRFEIKSRRLSTDNPSRELSAIRTVDSFDFLAGILFGSSFSVYRAALIPRAIVVKRAPRVAHTNALKFLLKDDVWGEPGVIDVTAKLQSFLKKQAHKSVPK